MTQTDGRPRTDGAAGARAGGAAPGGASPPTKTGIRHWQGWPVVARVGAALFAVALPVAVITSNLRLLFTTKPIYTFAVRQYDVPAVTGIPEPEIERAMDEIRDYFSNDQRLLRITVVDSLGRSNPLFTPREVIHMRDVKELVQNIFSLGTVATLYVIGYAAIRVYAQRGRGLVELARLTRTSMIVSIAMGVGFAVAATLGFDRLFEQFHLLSFSNDFWQLDPTRDHLVQMFPFPFWFVSTLILAGGTLVEFLILLILSILALRRSDAEPSNGQTTEAAV